MVDSHCREGNLIKAFKLWNELLVRGMKTSENAYMMH